MHPVSESDLHAYADGQLPGRRMATVEAYLAGRPDEAARVAAWRRQSADLHGALDGVLNEAVPMAALPPRLRDNTRPVPRGGGWRMAFAAGLASVVSLSLGGVAGWMAHGKLNPAQTVVRLAPGERFAREALATHVVYAPEVRHPVEVTANEEQHLVTWLSKRLGAPLRAPDLRAQGFRLMGGRLGVAEGGPSAILMYEAEDGTRLTLQLRHMSPDTPDTGFRLERMPPSAAGRPVNMATIAFYWVDRSLGFALAGPLDRDRLLAIAQAVYQQYQAS